MILKQNGFWAGLYRACRQMWADFIGLRYFQLRMENTDLCTFIRTIFLWAPLALIVNLATLAWVAYAVGDLLYMLWFELSTLGIVLLILGGAGLGVVILGMAIFFGAEAYDTLKVVLKDSETASIAKNWIVARKSSICPLITIQGE